MLRRSYFLPCIPRWANLLRIVGQVIPSGEPFFSGGRDGLAGHQFGATYLTIVDGRRVIFQQKPQD